MSAMQSADRHSAAGSPAILLQPAVGPVMDLDSLHRSRTNWSSWSHRRPKSKHGGRPSTSSGSNGMISPEEFEALPLSIQRKYFSQEERFRIAQQAAVQKRKRQQVKETWLTAPSSTTLHRPATSQGIQRPLTSHARSTASEVSLPIFIENHINDDQAHWFVTLPKVVRRQHFSPEEQMSSMARCEKILEEADYDVVNDALYGPQPRRSSLSSFGLNFDFDVDVDSDDDLRHREGTRLKEDVDLPTREDSFDSTIPGIGNVEAHATRHRPHVPSTEAHSIATFDATRLNTIPPLPPVPVDSPINRKAKRRTLSKALSLTPLPLPPPTLAPARPMSSSETSRRSSLSARMSRHFIGMTPPVPSPPPETKFYQDVDAREQLRKHLSPQKFDEAIEYGFASNDKRTPSPGTTDQSYPRQLQSSSQDRREAEDDSLSSSTTSISPRTPTAFPEAHPAIKQSSFDFGVGLPLHSTTRPKTPYLHSPADSAGTREMTIHMTLTRPELRGLSSHDSEGSVQRASSTDAKAEDIDPLALESISVCNDPTGAHGAFAVHDDGKTNGLKRVWKTIRRR